jgi:transposase
MPQGAVMGAIYARKKGDKTYYVYQEAYRVKLDPSSRGKERGSGKSAVRTRATYLGTAESIMERLQRTKEPLSVSSQPFGLVAAAYQTAVEIGLTDILSRHIPGDRGGVARWIYFFVSILNRLDNATSKNRMGRWLDHTILPQLLQIDPRKLTGKNFWYAADDIVSESEVRRRRSPSPQADDPLIGLSGDTFNQIEMDVFAKVDIMMGLSPSLICYDTTNFYTYIQEPARSELAHTCHSKAAKHHLKHVGLLMAVERSQGVPLVSNVYQANRHDSKVFSSILADLIVALKQMCPDQELVIVLDKGNNSKENFKSMDGKISWVGSLVPSHHKDLMERDVSLYQGSWRDLRYFRCQRTIMGIPCAVVLTFNPATKRKQAHSMARGIERLKRDLLERWNTYKRKPTTVAAGLLSIQKKSDYARCVAISVRDGEICFEDNKDEIEARKKRFGKSLIFSNMLEAETGYLIETYHQRNTIESDFQLLKDETIIRFRPIRHWTDSKIRAYAFCCVMALTLMRVMQWKAQHNGYKMSPALLKEELSDIRNVLMIYDSNQARRQIADTSAVQKKLWDVFKLGEVEKLMLQH